MVSINKFDPVSGSLLNLRTGLVSVPRIAGSGPSFMAENSRENNGAGLASAWQCPLVCLHSHNVFLASRGARNGSFCFRLCFCFCLAPVMMSMAALVLR